jgi:hypothetical protein
MKLIDFPGRNVVFAEDQPEYLPLPALRVGNAEGEIICCWVLTWRERLRLLLTGCIWHSVLTFNKALQPQLLAIEKPDAIILAEAKVRT